MKFEVAYFSKLGNATVLANAIASLLPAESTRLTDLAQSEMSGGADVNFIGFDINDGPLPLRIMDALDCAENRVLILFATCCKVPTDDIKAAVERKIYPFLPDGCDYRGLFLCAGQPPEKMIKDLEDQIRLYSYDSEIMSAYDNCQKTVGHPNEQDLETLQKFLYTALK